MSDEFSPSAFNEAFRFIAWGMKGNRMTDKEAMEMRMECLRLAVGVRHIIPNSNTTEIAEAYLKFVTSQTPTKRD